ncbi:MAG: hypothetical protein ACYCW6_25650 [Candidatus Xenobia bacterium]
MSARKRAVEAWQPRPYWQRLAMWLLMFAGAVGGVLATLHVVCVAWDARPEPPPPGVRQAAGESSGEERPDQAAAG